MLKGVSGAKALLGEAENLYKDAAGRNNQGYNALTGFVDSIRGLLGCSIDEFVPHITQARESFMEVQGELVLTEASLNQANQKVIEALGSAGLAGTSPLRLMMAGKASIEPFAHKDVLARLDSVATKTEALAGTTVRRIHSDVEAVLAEAQDILIAVPPITDQSVQATELCQQIQSTL